MSSGRYTPAMVLKAPRAPKESERQIHAAVIAHWKACGLPETLVATIPNQFAHGQVGLTKGLPDLLVMGPKGFVAGLELKAQGGRASLEQIAMQDRWRSMGVRYEITFGRDEPIQLLTSWGIVKGSASYDLSR